MLRPAERLRRSPRNLAQVPAGLLAASAEVAERRPARPPDLCKHDRFFMNCSLCSRRWDRDMGHVAPRR